jgi:AcrR family transcriptional regulator
VYESTYTLSSNAPRMAEAATRPARAGADKRQALLDAALRLIARAGLHDAPTSAVAREAGVAAGTLYLYFPSKEALINALYLQLVDAQHRAAASVVDAPDAATLTPRETFWRSWSSLARWHLDQPDASRVIDQCRSSGILSDETRDAEARTQAEGLVHFEEAIRRGALRPMPSAVFWALYAGPIFVLVDVVRRGEIDVTEDVLRVTFDAVCRALLPAPDAA